MENTAVMEKTGYEVVEGISVKDLLPMPHHLLLRWLDRKETKGGVLMPENRQRKGIMKGVILAKGYDCDTRLQIGDTVQFHGLCDKEFVGPQCPGDRDPVFFMREEDVIGVRMAKHLLPINGIVLVEPDLAPQEKGGIAIVNREQGGMLRSGTVYDYDTVEIKDLSVGDRLYFHSNIAEQLRLGDFEGRLVYVLRYKDADALEKKEETNG
jgi:co-chaperonin GroES (HSP10)